MEGIAGPSGLVSFGIAVSRIILMEILDQTAGSSNATIDYMALATILAAFLTFFIVFYGLWLRVSGPTPEVLLHVAM